MGNPTWIWYPGDFEVWLHWLVSLRREERGVIYPPFWRLDTWYPLVTFRKQFSLARSEEVRLYADGRYTVTLDGQKRALSQDSLTIDAGTHELVISVLNQQHLPALYVQGETLCSDTTWKVSHYSGTDGLAHERDNAERWMAAGAWNFDAVSEPPSRFHLSTREVAPLTVERRASSLLVDFGKEVFGSLRLTVTEGKGNILLVYGESQEEALSPEQCETLDRLEVTSEQGQSYELPTRAFRYIQILHDAPIQIADISLLYEYLPLEQRGTFHGSHELLNQIWETALYTQQLTTREFFLDGIKRDRWVWAGDAYQSALMNYYTFFDQPVTQRTFVALRGKDPVETHLNLIMDYTFFWFIGLYDYYLYTGDVDFIRQHYAKMNSLLEFCLQRRNAEGFMEEMPGDWVFIDWAKIDNRGEVSLEQILLCRSLEVMALFADLMDDPQRSQHLSAQAEELKRKIFAVFWDEEQGCLVHHRMQGQRQRAVSLYPNMFALLFGYFTEEQLEQVKRSVLSGGREQEITTPYMRFFALAMRCELGEHQAVLAEIEHYWGEMLKLGATTFWEEFDPEQRGSEHYAMYGRPFGKSLCHAWGASPLYLLGRYFLGVRPLTPGYQTYSIEPELGGLEQMSGTVPIPGGQISISADSRSLKVQATGGTGYLRFRSGTPPVSSRGESQALGNCWYQLVIDQPNVEYVVSYTRV